MKTGDKYKEKYAAISEVKQLITVEYTGGTGAHLQLFIKNGQFGENSLVDEDGNAKIEDYAPKDLNWYDAACVDGLVDASKMEEALASVKDFVAAKF